MYTIELKGITKTFGKHLAVDNLSLAVPQGSVYGFIGPNGSGKTTTLRMIMNIFYPDRGEILVFGEKMNPAITDRIGYMPEERGLYKRMKVRKLLRFYGDLKNGENIKEEVDKWLARLELSEWGDKKVETLSKGMSQKVQFTSTVLAKPDLVILDEPFAGLDPVNAEVIKDAILELQSSGTTVIFSTHDMNVAEKMCSFIFMIFKGRKVLDGTLESIQEEYGNDTIRIRTNEGISALRNLKGVEKVNNFGQMQELRISQDSDPQEVLKAIVERSRVNSFEVVKPSLYDIFLRIAGPEAREVKNEQDTQIEQERIHSLG
ncbi:ATP-binding cassette domain-containing protein [Candidatus Poribacteria bacterium]|nr:ATP-binding cassette domain-containing protein [Candidatus Poribacteria bacterium]